MTRLKSCPFCGAKPEYDKDRKDYYVSHDNTCYFDYIERSWITDNPQSRWAWNHRASAKRRGGRKGK